MPQAAPKPCSQCGVIVNDGTARCQAHKVRLGQFADAQRGSRHARGYGSKWDRLRAVVMRRDSGLCQVCLPQGRVVAAHHVDHKINKAQGGTDDEANLQAICRTCHRAKTAGEARGPRGR